MTRTGLRSMLSTVSAFAAAKREGTDENLHEWRKQTKYFANQLDMPAPLGAKLFVESHRHATQLADCLYCGKTGRYRA